MREGRALVALALVALLGACVRLLPGESVSAPSVRPSPVPSGAPVATALTAGLTAGPPVEVLGMASGDARLAMLSFVESCPGVLNRTDASGLTRQADWQLPCEAAKRWTSEASLFFATYFETVRVEIGRAHV